jgi:2-aminoadipate transaminase
MLGSFSKIIVPSIRVGWIYAPDAVMEKLLVAKQACDLHTNYLGQRLIYQYLCDNDIDAHIEKIKNCYKVLRDSMLKAVKEYFPEGTRCTEPEGGMFLWLTLPKGLSAMKLFNTAVENKVVFVPGEPFYTDGRTAETLRLNYTCMDEEMITEGIKRLAVAVKKLLAEKL